MRELRVTAWCDACIVRGEHTEVDETDTVVVSFNGRPPLSLDLCKDDRVAMVEPLVDLLNERGVKLDQQQQKVMPGQHLDNNGSKTMWLCPVCREERSGRTGILKHMVSMHGMTKVEASRAAPPRGIAVDCVICGFRTNPGTGYAAHVSTEHGSDVWAKVKADMEERISAPAQPELEPPAAAPAAKAPAKKAAAKKAAAR